jgi:hypothetical protein
LTISAIFTFIFLSSPLAEAQASLGGYGDLWISLGLLLSISFFIEYRYEKDKTDLFLAILLAIALIFTKNIGLIFTLSILATFVLAESVSRWGRTPIFLIFLSLFLATSGLHMLHLDLRSLGINFAILPMEGLALVGGRELEFVTNRLSSVFFNLYIAMFKQSSFGLVFYIVSISYFYLLIRIFIDPSSRIFSILCLFTFISCILFSSLRYTDYMFAYSHPGGDTSLSRALLNLFVLGFLVMATAIGE